jgi:hypothetical protein
MGIYGNYDDMMYMKQVEETGNECPRPLTFTGAELQEMYGPDGPSEEDVEALNLAMDRNMHERAEYWQGRALRAEEELRRIDPDTYDDAGGPPPGVD